MGSSENFQAGICSGGWWNPKRSSLFCAAPLSEFMWSNSALLGDMDNEQAEMKQQAASAATTAYYSRSDDSDDHHSSSAEHYDPVMTSNYRQIFQDTQKPLMADFGVSDYWLQADSLLNDASNSNMMQIFKQVTDDDQIKGNNCQEFYNLDQFDTTNFVASATDFMHRQQPPSTTANPAPNFWDSWMSTDEIGAPESHQLPAPALFEDQKPYNYGGNRFSDRSKMSPKIDNKKILGTKRKNTISDEPYKRARFETPSSLPTFKVRKEKLGDRITALQQLVSPFGKTDTASVLHEAVEYIKFLHDQVLRTPYMQNGTPTNQHQQMQGESKNTTEGPKDLRSRGLCLVPIPSTFPINQ